MCNCCSFLLTCDDSLRSVKRKAKTRGERRKDGLACKASGVLKRQSRKSTSLVAALRCCTRQEQAEPPIFVRGIAVSFSLFSLASFRLLLMLDMSYDRLPTTTFPPSDSPPLQLQSQSPSKILQQHRRLFLGVASALVLLVVGTTALHSRSSSAPIVVSGELAVKDYLGVEQKSVVLPVEEELRKFEWNERADKTLERQLKKLTSVRFLPFFLFPFFLLLSPLPSRPSCALLALLCIPPLNHQRSPFLYLSLPQRIKLTFFSRLFPFFSPSPPLSPFPVRTASTRLALHHSQAVFSRNRYRHRRVSTASTDSTWKSVPWTPQRRFKVRWTRFLRGRVGGEVD